MYLYKNDNDKDNGNTATLFISKFSNVYLEKLSDGTYKNALTEQLFVIKINLDTWEWKYSYSDKSHSSSPVNTS